MKKLEHNENETDTTEIYGDLERVLIQGDLNKLTEHERITYYMKLCQSLNLNPLTKPFEYFESNGKLILGARKGCSEQLRNMHQVSIVDLRSEEKNGLFIYWATATIPNGRRDTSCGVVSIEGLKGKNLANAIMTAETKAKNRVTLSLFGLGILDETELETFASPVKKEINVKLDTDSSGANHVLTTGKYKNKTLLQSVIGDGSQEVFDEFMQWVTKYGDNGLKQIPKIDMDAINKFLLEH